MSSSATASRARWAVALLVIAAVPSAVAAQHRREQALSNRTAALRSVEWMASDQARDSARARRTPGWAVLASAVVPGAGQAALGQKRAVVYLAIETYAWALYSSDRRRGNRARDAYRALARRVARSMFSPQPRDRDFEYYERMAHFPESGVFDASPGGSLDPETDTTTYNGSVWLLARQTYWEDPNAPPPRSAPEYLRAEAFYRARAVGDEDRWSWANADGEYSRFKATIRESNDGFRDALQDLGIVIANHALSTVDALATVRLARRPGPTRTYTVTASIPF